MSNFLYKIYNITKTNQRKKVQKKQHVITNPEDLFNCTKNSPELYTCYYCEFTTNLLVKFNKHASRTKVGIVKKPSKTTASYVCDTCKFETNSQLVLLKHIYTKCPMDKTKAMLMLVKSEENMRKLVYCESSSLKPAQIKQPEKATKPPPKPKNPLINKHQCPCFTHLQAKTAKSWFKCEHCPFKTAVRDTLRKHIICKHTASENIDWWQCPDCPFKAIWRNKLVRHFKLKHAVGDQVEWFQCDRCPHRTKWQNHLKRHIREQHLESFEALQCQHCAYKAKQKVHMRLHVAQKHTADEDVNWFKCEECPYKAKIKASLKSHVLKRHTSSENINWFVCEKCGHKALERSLLKKHMLKKH